MTNCSYQSWILTTLIVGGASVALAQHQDGSSLMTPRECEIAVNALKNGDLTSLGRIKDCGTAGATAIAVAIAKTSRAPVADAEKMQSLIAYSKSVRDNEVFAAAQEIAKNSEASPLARTASLYILALYYDSQLVFPATLESLANGPTACTSVQQGTGSILPVTLREIPADAPRIIAEVVDGIVRDAKAPASLRQMGRCLRVQMYSTVPSHLPKDALNIRYICENRFIVTNRLDEPIYGKYVVARLQDTIFEQELWMDALTSKTLDMPKKATVRILENGKVIAEASNSGKACHQ